MNTRKHWSFDNDVIIARFGEFLADMGKGMDDPDVDELFEEFVASQGDWYVHWESHWCNTS